VLQEDGEWHEATVEEVSATLPRMLVVRFRQWPKLQSTPATEVIAVSASVDDAQEEVQHGACELCKCKRRLTFHHLIPKETHHRFVGNSLPAGLDGEPTRIFLGSYGANLCRPCHSQVHRFAPNLTLAKHFNTVEKLLQQPYIERWVQYAATRKGAA